MEIHGHSRVKICTHMKSAGVDGGVVLLMGGVDACQYDSDTELLFR